MSKKLPANFLKEIYEKDQKYFSVYDTYTPNYKRSAITLKFYSKYESRVERECSDLVKKIKAVKDGVPKEKVNWPETTNQWYGWYIDPLLEVDRDDYRLHFHRKSTNL